MLDFLVNQFSLNEAVLIKLLSILFVVIILFFSRWLLLKLVFQSTNDPRLRYRWKKTSNYTFYILTVFFIAIIGIKSFASITTFLGLLSAGIAIALKDFIADLAGWLYIVSIRSFEVGDRIQVGKDTGDVLDVRFTHFTLMEVGNWVDAEQSTGRIILVPNNKVLTEIIANYSKGFQYIWNEIPVLITFESNWQEARVLLQNIANKHVEHITSSAKKKVKEAAKKYLIFYNKLTPIVYTSVEASGVLLTVRYLCKPKERRVTQTVIWEEILVQFAENNHIEFAYPTQRFYTTKDPANHTGIHKVN